MIKAAGILFVVGNSALFLRRNAAGDHPGEWCVPGGKVEAGESILSAAIREAHEECGQLVGPEIPLIWTRALGDTSPPTGEGAEGDEGAEPDTVDFTTYIVNLSETFIPAIDHSESDGYVWSPIDSPPSPLHPGVQVCLDRFNMDELDVAEAMSEGRLASPQRYENVWLFAMRVTGTGVSYRSGRKEFVLRDPKIYCNERFLKRCNGLQVIMEHPTDGSLLNDSEFKERTIGSVFLPYLREDKPDEVWCIAKIYDEGAAEDMIENRLSTSPAVNFSDPSVNRRAEFEGEQVLIEGDPSLLDHLAVCANGVWDKGGEPTGIESMSDSETAVMADSQKVDEVPSSPLRASDVNMVYAQAAALGLKTKLFGN